MDDWYANREAQTLAEAYHTAVSQSMMDAFITGLLLDEGSHVQMEKFDGYDQRARVYLNGLPYEDVFVIGNAPNIRIVRERSAVRFI